MHSCNLTPTIPIISISPCYATTLKQDGYLPVNLFLGKFQWYTHRTDLFLCCHWGLISTKALLPAQQNTHVKPLKFEWHGLSCKFIVESPLTINQRLCSAILLNGWWGKDCCRSDRWNCCSCWISVCVTLHLWGYGDQKHFYLTVFLLCSAKRYHCRGWNYCNISGY